LGGLSVLFAQDRVKSEKTRRTESITFIAHPCICCIDEGVNNVKNTIYTSITTNTIVTGTVISISRQSLPLRSQGNVVALSIKSVSVVCAAY